MDEKTSREKREQLRRKFFKNNSEPALIRKMTQVERSVRSECSRLGIPYEGALVSIGAIDGHSIIENPDLAIRLGLADGPVKKRIEERRIEIKKELLSQQINPDIYLFTGDGYPELKRLWAEAFNKSTGLHFNHDKDVFIVHGGMQAIHLGFQRYKREVYELFKEPIPSIVFPAPGFPCAIEQIGEIGAKADIIITRPENHFTISPDDVVRYHKSGGKGHIFYLTAINNPTSLEISWMRDLLLTIDKLYPQTRIILDGVYLRSASVKIVKEILRPFKDLGLLPRTIFIDSMSKVEGLTGHRIGCILHNSDKEASLIPELRTSSKIHSVMQNMLAGSSSEMQVTAQAFFEIVSDEDKFNLSKLLMERREILLNIIFNKHSNLIAPIEKQYGLPHGTRWQAGLYAWITLAPDIKFEEYYIKTGFSIVPSVGFYGRSCKGFTEYFGDDPNWQSYVRFSVGMQSF